MINQDNISISQRITAPKPPLFSRILKVVGTVTVISGIVAKTTIAIYPPIGIAAGIVSAVGAGITAAATLPVDFDKLNEQKQVR